MSSWSAPGGGDDGYPSRPPQDASPPPPVAPPYGAPGPYGAPDSYGAPGPYGAPDSYGAPASYGAPTFHSAPAIYGAPSPYGTPRLGGLAPYGRTPPMTSGWRSGTITQLVLSLLLTFLGCGLGLPSLILSIVAMTRSQTDGTSATRLAKVGWVCFGVAAALVVAFWAFFVSFVSGRPGAGNPVEQI
ncbi:hypothetical protein V3N99_06970 [Dermatophilaceae bacterium Soc4.6]